MTYDDDLDPLDELASNHLDGLTTADEAARIARDPEVQARVDAMAAVREALRSPVPIDAPDRDRAIAGALAAFDADFAATPPVADLRAIATRRPPSRAMRLVGIAAAAVALALAVPLLSTLGGDDADQEATSAGDEAIEEASGFDALGRAADDDLAGDGAEAAPAAPRADAAGGAGSQSSSTAEAADAGWLGEFTEPAELRRHVEELLVEDPGAAPVPGTSSRTLAESERGCRDSAEGIDEASASVVLVGTAVLDDRRVHVTVVDRPDGRRTLTVADPAASCEPLIVADLER